MLQFLLFVWLCCLSCMYIRADTSSLVSVPCEFGFIISEIGEIYPLLFLFFFKKRYQDRSLDESTKLCSSHLSFYH